LAVDFSECGSGATTDVARTEPGGQIEMMAGATAVTAGGTRQWRKMLGNPLF
jgi:hypothetical protein